jgi:hypothetical protein
MTAISWRNPVDDSWTDPTQCSTSTVPGADAAVGVNSGYAVSLTAVTVNSIMPLNFADRIVPINRSPTPDGAQGLPTAGGEISR